MNLILLLYFSVPSPNVEVQASQLGPYLAGMLTELRCSVDFGDSVDTMVDVSVVWERNGAALSETARVRTVSPRAVGASRYDALLQFSTLSSSADGGSYACRSTIFPTENTNYITNSTGTGVFSFDVIGKVTCWQTYCILKF